MKRELKSNLKPFISLMRLDKPIGSLLLLWPTMWALWIASDGAPNFHLFLVFTLGVITMRSAGCVINDIADRNFDSAVARTRNRPLAAGTLTIRSAILLFIGLCLIGLLLVIQLNMYTIKLSIVALVLAIVYPFTKRIIHLPQLVLGAAYAWSIPMAFAAVNNFIPSIGWLLFGIGVVWPVAYDTIYALMDKEDDIKIGVKSTAILFGKWDIEIFFLLQLFVISALTTLGLLLKFNFFYYMAILVAVIMVLYQVFLIRKRNNQSYYRAFYNNHWLGFFIFMGIIFNYL